MERHFEDYLQEAEFGVFEVTEGINSFDFILQFSHQGSDVASITNAANTYCDEYIAVYGIDKTCTICEDMMTFRVFVTDDNDGNENESDSAVSAKNDGGNEWLTWFIMSVGIFIVCGCVIFVLVHRWCRKEIRGKKENYYPTKAQVNAHKYGPSDKNRLEHNVTSHAVVAVNDA